MRCPKAHLVADDTADPAALAVLIREGLADGRNRLYKTRRAPDIPL